MSEASAPLWPDLDLTEASVSLRAGAISATELVGAHLKRMERVDGVLHAVVTSTADRARERAAEADRAGFDATSGILAGIPIGIKDNFATAGVRTTAATKALTDNVPTASAESVARLERSGAIVVAKLNMDELALGGPSGSDVAGVMVNPWDGIGSPGGSSGGSAAAVASAYCMAATGSDTGGSIRNPAGWCGVAGYKPTQGAIPTDGVVPVAWSLDTVGYLARTVGDCATLFAATADHFEGAETSVREAFIRRVGDEGTPGAWRIGVAQSAFDASYPEIRTALAPAIRDLERIGTVEEVPLPSLDDAMVAMMTISTCEARSVWAHTLEERPASLGLDVRARLDAGALFSADDYIAAQRLRQHLRNQVRPLFGRLDVIVMPTMGFPPGPDPFPGALDGPDHPEWHLSGKFTCLWSLTGNPVVSLPCGFTEAGRPASLQLIGPVRRDGRLLKFAAAAERAWAVPRHRLVPTWVRRSAT